MNLAYHINNNLSGDKILADISRLLQKIPREEIENTILTISLVKIQNSSDLLPPPNIEGSSSLSQPN